MRTTSPPNVTQVSFDITYKNLKDNVITTRIRGDFIEQLPSGKYKLIDAKYSDSSKDWANEWLSSCTPNQKEVYPAFQQGKVSKVTVVATESSKIDQLEAIGLLPGNLNISKIELEIYPSNPGSLEIDIEQIVKLK